MMATRDTQDARSLAAGTRWQLRVLNGTARGTAYVLEARLTIGRAASSDLQLVTQEVSRQHARIVEDGQGRHVLLDLDSSNGTYVDGELIKRRVLEPFAEITIADVELIYEPVSGHAFAAPTDRHTDVRTFRSTTENPVAVARSHAPTTPVGAAVPPDVLRDRDGRALVFEHPDGSGYEGNLIAEILEYRTLRTQQLRGGFGDPTMKHAFERLKARLQQPPSSDGRVEQRAFCRFGCWLPARVQLASGEELPCHIRDVGVDGAQIVVESHELRTDASVCLTVEVIEGGERRSIVLAARVAWADASFLGLAFAGAPRREDGRYAQQSLRNPDAEGERPKASERRPGLRMVLDPRQS